MAGEYQSPLLGLPKYGIAGRAAVNVAPRRQPASVLRFDQSSYTYLIHVDHHH